MADRDDDSDDRGPWIFVADLQVFSDRLVVWPIQPRKIFVNHGNGLRALAIVRGEGAAANERNPHGFKIIGADLANVAVRARVAGEFRAPFVFKGCGPAESAEWQRDPGGSGDDTGGTREPVENVAHELNLFRRGI